MVLQLRSVTAWRIAALLPLAAVLMIDSSEAAVQQDRPHAAAVQAPAVQAAPDPATWKQASEHGATRRVLVVDKDSGPVVGATVWSWTGAEPEDDPQATSVETGADGQADVNLGDGTCRVRAGKEKAGLSDIRVAPPAGDGALLVLPLQDLAHVIAHVTTADGEAAGGARVFVDRDVVAFAPRIAGQAAARVQLVIADEHGRVAFDVQAPVFSRVRAKLGADISPWLPLDVVERGETQSMELRLPGHYELSGTVRDTAGAPLAGADVQLVSYDQSTPIELRSDDAGAFRAALSLPGEYEVIARQPKLIQDGILRVTVDAGNPTPAVAITMKPGAAISGVVLSAAGTPVKFEMVSAKREQEDDLDDFSPHSFLAMFHVATAYTLEDGSFTLSPLDPAATYRVTGEDQELPGIRPDGPPLTIRGPEQHRVWGRGTVTRMDFGKLTPPCDVELVGAEISDPVRHVVDGHFEYSKLAFGARVYLRVHAQGFADACVGSFKLDDDEFMLDIAIGRPGALLVTVQDVQGRALPGATVRVWTGDKVGEDNHCRGSLLPAVTADDGTVRWTDLSPATYFVEASGADGLRGEGQASVPSQEVGRVVVTLH